jgi:ABC-type glutathione transport system ATPase component
MGTYDIQTNVAEEHFRGSLDLDFDWNIGLIVGRSGSGKTTIARELFGDNIISGYEYTRESILDDMPKGASVEEISMALTSLGFASPPSWLQSYSVLSNGE